MIWVKINFAIYIETNEEKFKKQGNFFLKKTKNRHIKTKGEKMQDTNNSVLFLFNRKKTLLLQNKIKKDMYSNADKIEWTLIFVSEFGRKFGLTMKQAFNYLTRYKGIDFIDRHYDYVHTQSFQSMITDISEYCHKKGGGLI